MQHFHSTAAVKPLKTVHRGWNTEVRRRGQSAEDEEVKEPGVPCVLLSGTSSDIGRKAPKRRQWWKKRGGFEAVPRLAVTK